MDAFLCPHIAHNTECQISNTLLLMLLFAPPNWSKKKRTYREEAQFLRVQVNFGRLEVLDCPTESQIAGVLTKEVKTGRFLSVRDELGVTEFEK